MIEKIANLPSGIDGVRSSGKLTREDYDAVIVPLVDGALRDHRKLRCLVEIPDYAGITPSAAFEDLSLGLRVLRAFDGCAIVTDLGWISELTRFAAFLMPYPVRVFPITERAQAIEWLVALPAGPQITSRVLSDAGVVVVEVKEPLRVQDVEALADVIDGWLSTHMSLHGLVVHATTFRGWENARGIVRHLQFVFNHHRQIERVALAVDGTLAQFAAALAEHTVSAEVRRFAFAELDAAIEWASTD